MNFCQFNSAKGQSNFRRMIVTFRYITSHKSLFNLYPTPISKWEKRAVSEDFPNFLWAMHKGEQASEAMSF